MPSSTNPQSTSPRTLQRLKIQFPDSEYRILTLKRQAFALSFDDVMRSIVALYEKHMNAKASRGLKIYFMDDENDWCVFDREVWEDLSNVAKLKLKVREREPNEEIDDNLQTSFMNLSDEGGLVLSEEDKNVIRDTCASLKNYKSAHEMADTVATVLGRQNERVEILEWIQNNVNLQPDRSNSQYQQRPYEQPLPGGRGAPQQPTTTASPYGQQYPQGQQQGNPQPPQTNWQQVQQQQQQYPDSGLKYPSSSPHLPSPYNAGPQQQYPGMRQPPAPAWEQQQQTQQQPQASTYPQSQVQQPQQYPQQQHPGFQPQQSTFGSPLDRPSSASSQSSHHSFSAHQQKQQPSVASVPTAYPSQPTVDEDEARMRDLLTRLNAMGFLQEDINRKHLMQNKMDISATVQSLLKENT